MLRLDHIVVVAETLSEGTDFVADALGVPLQMGGEHGFMGTHNSLLSLGRDAYLEVIAINPDAPAPDRARWFGMDEFKGAPRLTNWVCSSDDMERDLAAAAAGMEEVIDASRGDLRWRMAVPSTGQYPFGGTFPGMIEWQSAVQPQAILVDLGVRLTGLRIAHPEVKALKQALTELDSSAPVEFVHGPEPRLVANFVTRAGEVRL